MSELTGTQLVVDVRKMGDFLEGEMKKLDEKFKEAKIKTASEDLIAELGVLNGKLEVIILVQKYLIKNRISL